MGQKINPIIFRIGVLKNEWKSKYSEKNLEEFSFYSFQTLEIKKYLNQFLNESGLILHDHKIYFSTSTLHLYVSYFLTSKVIINISKIKKKVFKVKTGRNNSKISIFLKKKSCTYKRYEKFLQINKFNYQTVINKNNILEQILQALSLFLGKKLNISIVFQQVRKGLCLNFNALTNLDKKIVKTKFLVFRKYLKEPFFKDMLHVLILTVKLKNSADLLSNFISSKLTKMKNPNQFFHLLKHVLITLQKTRIFKIKGIKIKISGRFHSKPRTNSKLIVVGQIPVQTLITKIDYSESVSYTSSGTFGIKIWINNK